VRPAWSVNDETRPWLGCSGQVQDVDMPRLAAIAREKKPRMIIVDRSVGGRYENYRTPEKQVPHSLLPYPWETCMTMGDSWSYVPDDHYKSTRELIHMLCDVVAKGSNLLLNVGPDADGNLPAEALQRMEEMGRCMDKIGHAIYGSRPLYPYCDGNRRYTQSKDGSVQYELTLTDSFPYATVRELKGKARRK
jgi:alpha-L-fucosidase